MLAHRARQRLIRILRAAHAGERAAALAYAGHAQVCPVGAERDGVQRIAAEEREHRARLEVMLRELGSGPSPLRESVLVLIGASISALCLVLRRGGAHYGAGLLEAGNVGQYGDAADAAAAAGLPQYVVPLRAMAMVEWEHEQWFRQRLAGHVLLRLLPLWREPQRPSLMGTPVAAALPAFPASAA